MAERSSVVRLLANISDFKAQMEQARKSVKGVGDESEKTSRQATTTLGRMAESAQKNRAAWNDAGTALTAFGAVTVAGLGAAVKAAVDWESAWAGVRKTVNGSDQQLAEIEQGLRGLARTLPATHGEIAAVAEAAGQLGVQTKSIVSFTKTMVDLGETTNLSADAAATSLAQLMNVMGTAPDDVGRLGAALVALGNAGASTEADIVNMASYLTGSAKLIGASESDVLALANAMTSMGINAERGGGVMTRVMQDVYAAVQTGGTELEGFAKVAGMSADEFARAFEADPIRAIDAFVQGLNDVEASGGNVVAALNDLGFKGTQDTAVLLQMKGAGDLLTESLDLGSRAWEENTALVQEAAKRYDTTAAKLEIARNNITEAGIEIGQVFLPILADLAGGVADVAAWFADLPEPMQAVVGGLGAVAGVGTLAAGGFLLLFPRVIETYKAFQTLKELSPGVASGLGRLGTATRVAAGMAALGLAVRALDEAMAPAPASMEEATRAVLDMGGSIDSLDARFDRLDENLHGWTEIDNFGDAVRRIADPTNTERLNDFGGALFNVVTLGMSGTGEGAASRRRSLGAIKEVDGALALMVQNGNAELAAQQFTVMRQEAERQGVSLDELKELYPEYQGALAAIENEQREAAESADLQAAATARLRDVAGAAYGSLETYAAALGLSEEATEKLIEDSNALGESLGAFIDPLGAYTGLLQEKKAAEEESARATAEATGSASGSWKDFVGDVDVSLDEYMARLEEQLTAQQDWQLNMLLLAGRVSEGTLAELAQMGPEGAALVADLVNASDAELDRFDDITAARSKEATDAWGATLTLAAPVLAEIGKTAGSGVVAELAAQLAAGTTTVAAIAAEYGIALANGVNPILVSLGKGRIRVDGRPAQGHFLQADGGVMDFYADGGVENHVAQIAPAGAWRVWAEPETGGEAYIPLSPAKRTRSVDIWRQVGDRLGVQFAEFKFGGINDVPRPPSTAPYQAPISTAGDAAMQKAYGDTVDWLKANLAPQLGPGIGYQAMMAALHTQFPGLALHSGFRPGSITATGNLSYHALGRAVDVPPRMDVFNWIAQHYGPQSRELIFSPADGRQWWNGRNHLYGEPTRGDHWDHVHWAMARGGILDFFKKGGPFNPHVRDAGGPLLPGYTFNGTGGLEDVVPRHVTDARAAGGALIDYDRLAKALQGRSTAISVTAPPNEDRLVRKLVDAQYDLEFLRHG